MPNSKLAVIFIVLVAMVGIVSAQVPALSAVATTTPAPPTITLSVTNAAANSHVILAGSLNQGPGTMGGITLGIATPWFFMDMGTTNSNGALTLVVNVNPASLPNPLSGTTAYTQAGVVTMQTTMGGGGMTGGGMNGGGMTGGGTMGGGGMGSGSMSGGGTINCNGMTITLSNVASFIFP